MGHKSIRGMSSKVSVYKQQLPLFSAPGPLLGRFASYKSHSHTIWCHINLAKSPGQIQGLPTMIAHSSSSSLTPCASLLQPGSRHLWITHAHPATSSPTGCKIPRVPSTASLNSFTPSLPLSFSLLAPPLPASELHHWL